MPVNQTTIAPLSANQNPIAAMNTAYGKFGSNQLLNQKIIQQQALAKIANPMATQALQTAMAHTMQAQQHASAAAAATNQAWRMINPTVATQQGKANLLGAQQQLTQRQTLETAYKAKIQQVKALNEQGVISNQKAAQLINAYSAALSHPAAVAAFSATGTNLGKVGGAIGGAISGELSGAQNNSMNKNFQKIGNHKGAPSPYHLTQQEINFLPLKVRNGVTYHWNPKTDKYYPM